MERKNFFSKPDILRAHRVFVTITAADLVDHLSGFLFVRFVFPLGHLTSVAR